eukprot:CFRG5501T1
MVFAHGWITIHVQEGRNLRGADLNGLSDPYVTVDLGKRRLVKTKVMKETLNPQWNEVFKFPLNMEMNDVIFTVKDKDLLRTDKLGYLTISAEKLLTGHEFQGWFPLAKKAHEECVEGAPQGEVKIHIQFVDSVTSREVPDVYFPLQENNKCFLYQDAHHDDGDLPEIKRADGQIYEHGQCWKDLYHAIMNAKSFIYITGWSVWTETVLIRDEGVEKITLGEILKRKAAQGVKICMLVWNEKTTKKGGTIDLEGMMGTHDEETNIFFEDVDGIKCKLASRYNSHGKFTQFCFTHHQKSVILDAESAIPDKRRTIAFMGGLDLCDGRYDTPKHPLYRTLQGVHKGDFHNVWPLITSDHGPREPWHDIHCRVEGPGALDIMQNFLDRWEKQGHKYLDKLRSFVDDDDIMLTNEEEAQMFAKDPERWSTQLFRSIDGHSTHFSELSIKEKMTSLAKLHVDKSIQTAMIHHIRRAEKFIYIENQYFIGSSLEWEAHTKTGAVNVVPLELATQIVLKIREGKRFAVYVLLPMFCESWPEETTPQEILHFQYRTYEFMYKKIAAAIQETGIDAHPQDYLQFFCLGCRETLEGSQHAEDPDSVIDSSLQAKLNASRRYMTYVHSKMMIVDDEYIMVGSANINERSLAGDRDSEMCTGMFQPEHVRTQNDDGTVTLPSGDVAAFRKSLWAEHAMSMHENPLLDEPESLECIRFVRATADKNWEKYIGEEVVDMEEHLMPYPLEVTKEGEVHAIPGVEQFPDTNASILGFLVAIQETFGPYELFVSIGSIMSYTGSMYRTKHPSSGMGGEVGLGDLIASKLEKFADTLGAENEADTLVYAITSREPVAPTESEKKRLLREVHGLNRQIVLKALINRMSKNNHWRVNLKALSVIDYLIEKAQRDVISDLVKHKRAKANIRNMIHFEYLDGVDKGIKVREKAVLVSSKLREIERGAGPQASEGRGNASENRSFEHDHRASRSGRDRSEGKFSNAVHMPNYKKDGTGLFSDDDDDNDEPPDHQNKTIDDSSFSRRLSGSKEGFGHSRTNYEPPGSPPRQKTRGQAAVQQQSKDSVVQSSRARDSPKKDKKIVFALSGLSLSDKPITDDGEFSKKLAGDRFIPSNTAEAHDVNDVDLLGVLDEDDFGDFGNSPDSFGDFNGGVVHRDMRNQMTFDPFGDVNQVSDSNSAGAWQLPATSSNSTPITDLFALDYHSSSNSAVPSVTSAGSPSYMNQTRAQPRAPSNNHRSGASPSLFTKNVLATTTKSSTKVQPSFAFDSLVNLDATSLSRTGNFARPATTAKKSLAEIKRS